MPTSTKMPGRSGALTSILRHLLPGQELAHDERDEAPAAAQLALDAGALVVGERDDLGERVQRVVDALGLLGGQQGAPVQLVAADDLAEPVEDAPARRRGEAGAMRLLSAERRVALALDHLHLVQLGAERAEDADLPGAEQQRAAGEDAAGLALALERAHACSGLARPRWARMNSTASAG